jgi:hypothetical protein
VIEVLAQVRQPLDEERHLDNASSFRRCIRSRKGWTSAARSWMSRTNA